MKIYTPADGPCRTGALYLFGEGSVDVADHQSSSFLVRHNNVIQSSHTRADTYIKYERCVTGESVGCRRYLDPLLKVRFCLQTPFNSSNGNDPPPPKKKVK